MFRSTEPTVQQTPVGHRPSDFSADIYRIIRPDRFSGRFSNTPARYTFVYRFDKRIIFPGDPSSTSSVHYLVLSTARIFFVRLPRHYRIFVEFRPSGRAFPYSNTNIPAVTRFRNVRPFIDVPPSLIDVPPSLIDVTENGSSRARLVRNRFSNDPEFRAAP